MSDFKKEQEFNILAKPCDAAFVIAEGKLEDFLAASEEHTIKEVSVRAERMKTLGNGFCAGCCSANPEDICVIKILSPKNDKEEIFCVFNTTKINREDAINVINKNIRTDTRVLFLNKKQFDDMNDIFLGISPESVIKLSNSDEPEL